SKKVIIMSCQTQKVAVVTGAPQGPGAAIAGGYRKLGHAVVATSRTIAPSNDANIVTVQGDIADPATAERVTAAGAERFGRIDARVNNAGTLTANPFPESPRADSPAVLGVTLSGFFRIPQLAIEQMLPQGGGHIVNIPASVADNADSRAPAALASLT